MRAIRYSAYGGPEVLELAEAIEIREPAPGEALVRVAATSVNPADWKFRAGWFREWLPLPLPFIPGSDVAGTIERINGEVAGLSSGNTVIGVAMPQVGGASAEFAVLPVGSLACAPASLPLAEVAGVPLAALTAWYALFDSAGLEAGQRVLILGAAGGVGSFAVQLARHAGAHVVAATSPAKHALVRSLGAVEAVDYTSDLAGQVRNIDVVLDPWGGEVQRRSFATLRPGGTLVTLDPVPPPAELCDAAGIKGAAATIEPDAGRLSRIVELIDAGAVRVVIDSIYPLEALAAAHARSENGHVTGKVIVEVG